MKHFFLISSFLLIGIFSFAQEKEDSDRLVFDHFMSYSKQEKLQQMQIGEQVAAIARFFIGTPYVASTLEVEGDEALQVNLRGLDCTTFVETVLALHVMLKENDPNFQTYKLALTKIRYRSGQIYRYPSRLHYTSDWLYDNRQKGLIDVVKMGKGSRIFKPLVGFMSTHPEAYPALKAHPEFVQIMAGYEVQINQMRMKFLPKEKLTDKAPFIHIGDIIAITTSVEGLDFSHLGFAVREKGKVYLLHASSSGKRVMISTQSLNEYLSEIKKHTGIVVARPL